MNQIELISPKIIKQTGQTLIATWKSSFDYTDPVLNIQMTKSITTIAFTEFRVNNNEEGINMSPVKEESFAQYAGMQALLKSCVDNAEDIKNRLLSIVLTIKNPKTEEEKAIIMKMDLMNLKQSFMDEIRDNKTYKGFKTYNSTKKLKPFSQNFHKFIMDRNKYTHGELCFVIPNYDFALEYIETPSQQKVYALVDTSHVISYNNFYKEIREVITEYNVINQGQIN